MTPPAELGEIAQAPSSVITTPSNGLISNLVHGQEVSERAELAGILSKYSGISLIHPLVPALEL